RDGGICTTPSRSPPRPSGPEASVVFTPRRGRAVRRPSFAAAAGSPDARRVTPSANAPTAAVAETKKVRLSTLSLPGRQHHGFRRRRRMRRHVVEPRVLELLLELVERVRVAGGRPREHREAEGCRPRRRHAIRVWNEFEHSDLPAWLERRVH